MRSPIAGRRRISSTARSIRWAWTPEALGRRLDAIAQRPRRRPSTARPAADRGDLADAHLRSSRRHGRDQSPSRGRWDIPVVEDAAESLGSTYKGHAVGSQARLAALSFNGNKIVTTGGGGAILTNDEELGRRAKHLTTTAKAAAQMGLRARRDRLQLPSSQPECGARLRPARAARRLPRQASACWPRPIRRAFSGVRRRAFLARAGGHHQQLLAERDPAGRGSRADATRCSPRSTMPVSARGRSGR